MRGEGAGMMVRGLQDEGSLVAASGHRHAAHLVHLGLVALQHRGRAGVGLASADGASVSGIVGAGSVDEVLHGRTVDRLDGRVAVGRLTGAPELGRKVAGAVAVYEPVVRSWRAGRMAVATSGRLSNGAVLRRDIVENGGVLAGASDGELVAALIATQRASTWVNQVVSALHELRGAFCVAVATEDRLVVARDPRGFRPLVVGRVGAAVVVASEDVALRDLGAQSIRPVAPGEVLIVEGGRMLAIRPFLERDRAASLVDLVALARDDAVVDGLSALETRLALGRALASERPVEGVVVGLPESSTVAAGYAAALGRTLHPVLLPGPSSDRAPAPADVDESGVVAPLRAAGVRGADVVLVVPALTEGSRTRAAVEALRRSGAVQIHLRIASPPMKYPDPYGLALPPPEALIAVRHPTPESLADALAVDSAAFLSLAGLRASVATWRDGWCDTVWSGQHPEPPDVAPGQLQLFGDGDAPEPE